MPGPEARERLSRARLCLVLPAGAAELLRAALAGGVDLVWLRDSGAALEVAASYRRLCAEACALFVVGDPELARAVGADGVHLEVPERPAPLDDLLVGWSVATREQIEVADGLDYLFVGPVFATPTKPGQAPVGLELVREAARCASLPFFAVGGIDSDNVGNVLAAGAARIAVVRAIAETADPRAAASALRAALDASGSEHRAH